MSKILKFSAAIGGFMLIWSGAYGAGFSLSSPQFKDGDYIAKQQVFAGFGCKGGNVSPALSWQGAPQATKSISITVYDPDAPTGSGWWHWVVANIPPQIQGLALGAGAADGVALPAGSVQVRTDFGKPGYGGPCPPQGDHPHRYLFTVYALDVKSIPVKPGSSAALVGFYLNFHTLAKTSLMGLYKR